MVTKEKKYQWAIVGAGPAGIAAVGLLLDAGVKADSILWFDPNFDVGDFNHHWLEVSSNTTVKLFDEFLSSITAFNYSNCPKDKQLGNTKPASFVQLKQVAKPLQWITSQLLQRAASQKMTVEKLSVQQGHWLLESQGERYFAEKVVLATGAKANSFNYSQCQSIDLAIALNPLKLAQAVNASDKVAVFGSSHSAMIIIRSLLEAGVSQVVNFYLSTLKFAVSVGDWILYDNTGLKGETAAWAHENISKQLHPRVTRHLSSQHNIDTYLSQCNKAIYAVGFSQRSPEVINIDTSAYDKNHGIIAPGLFGCGIGFPREVADPLGRKELNVGLFKFLKDLRQWLPLWMKYPI